MQLTIKTNQPNCKDMLKYLLDTSDYSRLSEEDLKKDSILEVVASSCGKDFDEVIKIMQDMIIAKYHKN